VKTLSISAVAATVAVIALLPLVAATGNAVGRVLGLLMLGG
jgi:hypothetical protein